MKKTKIQTMDINGRKVVQEGLKDNDKIIENPDDALKDGAEIQVNTND